MWGWSGCVGPTPEHCGHRISSIERGASGTTRRPMIPQAVLPEPGRQRHGTSGAIVDPQARPFPWGTLFVQVPRGPSPKRSWTAVWGSEHEAFIANPFPGGTAPQGWGSGVEDEGIKPGFDRADSTRVLPRRAPREAVSREPGRLSRRRRTARVAPGSVRSGRPGRTRRCPRSARRTPRQGRSRAPRRRSCPRAAARGCRR